MFDVMQTTVAFFPQRSHRMHAPARKQCVRSADCAKGQGEQRQSAQRLGWDIFCYSHVGYVLLLTNLFMVILIDLLRGLVLPSNIEGSVLIVTTRQKNLQFHPFLATDKHLMSYFKVSRRIACIQKCLISAIVHEPITVSLPPVMF